MKIAYLIRKEFKQMRRNILLPIIFVLLPLALTNIVPRVATQEVKGLKICIVDNDHSTLSRRLIQKIDASAYIDLSRMGQSEKEAMQSLDDASSDLFLIVPDGYEKSIYTHDVEQQLYIAANATNGMKGAMGQNYVQQIIASFILEIAEERGVIQPQIRFVFNPHLDYKIYMMPAVFALMLTLIVGFLPALNIVGEKEKGTIEQVNVTPISKVEFIISKLVPYWCAGMMMSILALGAGRGLYGILPAGSVPVLFLFLLVFCMLVSSFALIISNYSDSIRQASLTMFFFLVIFILMSGILTPIRSMPVWAQWLSMLDPM
ncbi:MAG: ABC transporter permease, partial [Bacteroidaceae bacterium]|nr:ABC transporter permease [Bacteroidaceae bacterium]